MDQQIKAIETVYNGYRFRSRLEARWAVFFDTLGIKYEYEPEGYELSDGTLYLPDFWLPECKEWFEVKGVMSESDRHKIYQLAMDTNYPVVIGYTNAQFEICSKPWDDPSEKPVFSDIGSWLAKCETCGKYWFLDDSGYYGCRCCDEYDGDHHLGEILDGFEQQRSDIDRKWAPTLFKAVDAFKQARFDHGQTPRL